MIEPERVTTSPTRRRILATVGSCGAVGLAGCSGGSNGGSAGDTQTETTTQTEDRTRAENRDGSTTPSNQGIGIPGEVIHNGVDELQVVNHYVSEARVLNIQVRNTSEKILKPYYFPRGSDSDEGVPAAVAIRLLTEGGNEITVKGSETEVNEIKPGTEATFTSANIPSETGQYELCINSEFSLSFQTYPADHWDEACG